VYGDALFRRGGKHLRYYEANIFGITRTKLFQNRLGFVDDVTKTFWCFCSVHSSNCCSLTKRKR